MATASLGAEVRNETGTGVARKLRQSGRIPGIIYGHGRSPQTLSLNEREVERLLSTVSAGTTVIELGLSGATSRTLIREIQRHPVKRNIIHIDFQELVAGEKVTVNVPIRFVGIPDGVRNAGGILDQTMHQIHVRVDPADIPDHIDVDVTALTIGHSIHVRELKLPAGATILDDVDATVCVVTAPKAVEETVAAPAEGEAVAAAAEPELIRKPKPEDEEGEEPKK